MVGGAGRGNLDAGAEVARQMRYQLAEVGALLAKVVDDHVLAAEDGLDLDDLHREAHGGRALAHRLVQPAAAP